LPLFIDHRDWFGAYLERTGLAAEAAPPFVRLPHDYGEDMAIDYRPEKVVDATEPGPRPAIALNVCICWPEDSGRPGKYSYVAIAADGVQICRARARKAFFEVVSTVTVYPGRPNREGPAFSPS